MAPVLACALLLLATGSVLAAPVQVPYQFPADKKAAPVQAPYQFPAAGNSTDDLSLIMERLQVAQDRYEQERHKRKTPNPAEVEALLLKKKKSQVEKARHNAFFAGLDDDYDKEVENIQDEEKPLYDFPSYPKKPVVVKFLAPTRREENAPLTVFKLSRYNFEPNVLDAQNNHVEHWIIRFCHDWFAPCSAIDKAWAETAIKMQRELNADDTFQTRVRFADVDCSTDKPLCNDEGVKSFPNVIHYRQHVQVNSWSGGSSRDIPRFQKWAQKRADEIVNVALNEPAQDASAPPPPLYYQGALGSQCGEGTEPIASLEECLAAIHSLGLSSVVGEWFGKLPELPGGCSWAVETTAGPHGQAHWNTADSGKGHSSLTPICKDANAGSDFFSHLGVTRQMRGTCHTILTTVVLTGFFGLQLWFVIGGHTQQSKNSPLWLLGQTNGKTSSSFSATSPSEGSCDTSPLEPMLPADWATSGLSAASAGSAQGSCGVLSMLPADWMTAGSISTMEL